MLGDVVTCFPQVKVWDNVSRGPEAWQQGRLGAIKEEQAVRLSRAGGEVKRWDGGELGRGVSAAQRRWD